MPAISSTLRLILLILAGIGGTGFAIILPTLQDNLTYTFKRIIRGKKKLHLASIPPPQPARYWVALTVCIFLSVVGVSIASTAPALDETPKMSGEFRIAIASFQVERTLSQKDLGKQLAETVRLRLIQDIEKVNPGIVITVWGPEDLASRNLDYIDGGSTTERNAQSEALAEQIDANMVVYGSLRTDQGQTIYTPEFSIREKNFYEAQEITGPHEFGEPIILKPSETGGRIQVGSQMFLRCAALTNIVVGLAHYYDQDYGLALESYQQADAINNWVDPQSKKVLDLLMGNAALRKYTQFVQEKQPAQAVILDEAEQYYSQAMKIDDQYARIYIGLGSVAYLKALLPFQQSRKPADIDDHWLETSRSYYKKALSSTEQPPQADIPTKAQFGFGQVDLMKAYSGRLSTLDPAVSEFRQVIKDYGDGKKPEIQDLAAEAHARLGLAFDLSGHPEDAAREYQRAADLLMENPDRRKQYQSRANILSAITPTP